MRAEWGSLRQYLHSRLGWILDPTITSTSVTLTLKGFEPANPEATQQKPLLFPHDQTQRSRSNRAGIRAIIWYLQQIFGTAFEKKQKGRLHILTPIIKT
jgi:hypothetical protein